MSQFDWGTMDPNIESGTQLASDLNDFRDALNSLHRGSSRPSYAQVGTLWLDDVSAPFITLYVFDGTQDIKLHTYHETDDISYFQVPTLNGLPTVAQPFQLHLDRSTTPDTLVMRDFINANWVTLGELDLTQWWPFKDGVRIQTSRFTSTMILAAAGPGVYAVPANLDFVEVELVGGGAGGGSFSGGPAGGGGSGGYARGRYPASSLTAPVNYVVGAGGGIDGNGVTTSFDDGPILISATGGTTPGAGTLEGGAPGVGSGGINILGGYGGNGTSSPGTDLGGHGGGSFFGGGGRGAVAGSSSATIGTRGAGGGGAATVGETAAAGGIGIILVHEYLAK